MSVGIHYCLNVIPYTDKFLRFGKTEDMGVYL